MANEFSKLAEAVKKGKDIALVEDEKGNIKILGTFVSNKLMHNLANNYSAKYGEVVVVSCLHIYNKKS